jgi:hypothetical protein
MELSDEQKRLVQVAAAIGGMLEQVFTMIPHVPGQAGNMFVEEATVLQGNEEADLAMLWGHGTLVNDSEMSGFHLNIDSRSYRVFIEEM